MAVTDEDTEQPIRALDAVFSMLCAELPARTERMFADHDEILKSIALFRSEGPLTPSAHFQGISDQLQRSEATC